MKINNIQPVMINQSMKAQPAFKAKFAPGLMYDFNFAIRYRLAHSDKIEEINSLKKLVERVEKYSEDIAQTKDCATINYNSSRSGLVLGFSDDCLNRFLCKYDHGEAQRKLFERLMDNFPAEKIKEMENEALNVMKAKQEFKETTSFIFPKPAPKEPFGFWKRLFGKK